MTNRFNQGPYPSKKNYRVHVHFTVDGLHGRETFNVTGLLVYHAISLATDQFFARAQDLPYTSNLRVTQTTTTEIEDNV